MNKELCIKVGKWNNFVRIYISCVQWRHLEIPSRHKRTHWHFVPYLLNASVVFSNLVMVAGFPKLTKLFCLMYFCFNTKVSTFAHTVHWCVLYSSIHVWRYNSLLSLEPPLKRRLNSSLFPARLQPPILRICNASLLVFLLILFCRISHYETFLGSFLLLFLWCDPTPTPTPVF